MTIKTQQPVGKLQASFEELHKLGCIQTGADVCSELAEAETKFARSYLVLMQLTQHNICDGCPAWKEGRCKAYQQYHTQAKAESERAEQARQEWIQRQLPKTLSAREEKRFRDACFKLGIEPTKRQRRKYANKEGMAYKFRMESQ
jgi:hypothetical protein